jgi:hypothetical protein
MGRKALDVLNLVCDHLGWKQLPTIEDEDTLPKDSRKMVRALNRVLRVMSNVQDWRFLRVEGEIITTAEYTTGTARMTNASTAVTGRDDTSITGTLLPTWTTAMVGRAFVASGTPLVYRIVAVNSATSLTLNRAWQGDTTDGSATPDLNYQILQDRYDLPDDMDRPIEDRWSLFREQSVWPVFVRDADFVRDRRDTRAPDATQDDPDAVTLWDMDSQGEHRVAILDPFPRFQRVITFPYMRIHPVIDRDIQRILYPPRYEEVIVDAVTFLLQAGPDDDNRTDLALGEFLRQRLEAASAREIGQKRLRLTPSKERVVQQQAKFRRNGVRVDWGSYFDRVDFYDLER